MEQLFEHFAEIIKVAASSQLGVVSLIALLLGMVAFYFFKDEGTKIKAFVLVLLILSAGVLLYSISNSAQKVAILADAGVVVSDIESADINVLIDQVASDGCPESQLSKAEALESIYPANEVVSVLLAAIEERSKTSVSRNRYFEEKGQSIAPECGYKPRIIYRSLTGVEELAGEAYYVGIAYLSSNQYMKAIASFRSSKSLYEDLYKKISNK